MKLSTKARYGLRALCHVAHRGYASAGTIAKSQGIPTRYLEEIIGELRRAGLVIGKRGPRGGYRLARPPEEIMLSQIWVALQSQNPFEGTGDSLDEIVMSVERSVDHRLDTFVGDLRLSELIGEARAAHQQSLAQYQI